MTGPGPMTLVLPPRTTADVRSTVPAQWAWQEAVTIGGDGTELGRAPVTADRVIRVHLPDDYVGPYEVHLLSAEGARLIAVEGRRRPPQGRP